MTKLLLTLCFLYFSGRACSRKVEPMQVTKASLVKTDTIDVRVEFDPDIKLILKTRCTPCHFPGGSMYAKLPFDNPQTIRDHPEGIFKRLKDPEEVKKLRAFLEQKTQ